MQLNKKDLEIALGDNLVIIKGNFTIQSYSIDTRTLKEGDCFIALKAKADGHQYLDVAISKGAIALLVAEEFYNQNSIDFTNIIVVKDTLKALSKIAEFNAEIFKDTGGKLIGITGSVGKTTLKEMLQFVLSQNNIVSATLGNFNNHIGLPLCLAQIKKEAKFGVYEMGMSAKGEISFLAKILKPNVGIITEIATAHTEFFTEDNKSPLDQIADAKAEILEGLDEKSLLFLNKDNQYFNYIKDKALKKGMKEIYSFSQDDVKADIYIKSTSLLENYYMLIKASVFGEEIQYKINSMAKHNATAAALALAIAKKLKVNINEAVKNFVDFKIPKGRGEISLISYDNKNIILIDDSYNANPTSMNSAILSLKNINNKKIIILGDMLELGEAAVNEHIKLKESLKELEDIKEVILVGSLMKNLYNECKDNLKLQYFKSYELVIDYINSIIDEGDLIFIKGSLGSGVINISKYLQSKLNNL